jgi:hypothetical protein
LFLGVSPVALLRQCNTRSRAGLNDGYEGKAARTECAGPASLSQAGRVLR